jgi:hypothetical protein
VALFSVAGLLNGTFVGKGIFFSAGFLLKPTY